MGVPVKPLTGRTLGYSPVCAEGKGNPGRRRADGGQRGLARVTSVLGTSCVCNFCFHRPSGDLCMAIQMGILFCLIWEFLRSSALRTGIMLSNWDVLQNGH